MRLDRKHLKIHLLWSLPAACLVIGLTIWYTTLSLRAGYWLGGSSLPGLVCGLLAGGVIAFEMLLWPRKFLRAWRLIATKHWLAAHLWFGLASWPLAIVHSGFHLGGILPGAFMVLFTLTIISGIYGWVLQNIIPKLLLRQVTSETIYSQIELICQRNAADARAMLITAVGPPPDETAPDERLEHELRASRNSAVVVGAIREVGRVRGRTLRTSSVQVDRKDADKLWNAFSEIRAYIEKGRTAQSPFVNAAYSNEYFSGLRRASHSQCAAIINSFEEYCNQRRQFDLQKKLHLWMHSWLPVHIGLSVAVSAMLVLHIYTALRFL